MEVIKKIRLGLSPMTQGEWVQLLNYVDKIKIYIYIIVTFQY